MPEADILAQLQASRYNLSVIASQLLGLNLAMIVGIYYFLHRAGIVLKLIAFLLFTAGYCAMLLLFMWENLHLDGLEFALHDLVKSGEASVTATRLYEGWGIGRSALPDILVSVVILSGWISIFFLMFFYSFRERLPKSENTEMADTSTPSDSET